MRCRFEVDGNTVTATCKYAGKIITAHATCHPEDAFSQEIGEMLARKRLTAKVARKRYKYYEKELARISRELRELGDLYYRVVHNLEAAGDWLYASEEDLIDYESEQHYA